MGLAQIGREVGRKGGCRALGLGEAGREAAQARRGQRAGERARPILNRCSQQGKERSRWPWHGWDRKQGEAALLEGRFDETGLQAAYGSGDPPDLTREDGSRWLESNKMTMARLLRRNTENN